MNDLPKSKTYGVRLNKDKYGDIMEFLENHNHSEILLNALIQYIRRPVQQGGSEQSSVESGCMSTQYERNDEPIPKTGESTYQVNVLEVSQETEEVYESIYDILGGI
jgi:hypothetical protein